MCVPLVGRTEAPDADVALLEEVCEMGRATVAEDTLYRAAEVDAPLVTKGCEREGHLARRLVLKHLYSVCMAGGRGVCELLVRGGAERMREGGQL